MRKLFYISILAACGFAAAGCSEKCDENGVSHNKYLTEFTAEAGNAARTSVNLADGKVAWEAGDAVIVSNGEAAAEFVYDAAQGKFLIAEGELAATGDYKAIYPASIYTGLADGKLSVNLPAEQVYGEGVVKNAPMAAASSTEHFVFANLCGILELTIDNDKTVERIVFTADAGVAGAATVADGVLTMASDAARSLALDCASGVESGEGKFAFAVPAQTYAGGFSLAVHFTDGTVFTKSTTIDRTIAANRIDAMAAFKSYYFSGGKGTEAEPYLIATAADVAELSALSNGDDEAEFNAACYRQTADIDLVDVTYVPLAAKAMFSGVYDGGEYALENLTIVDYAVNNCGLVGNLSGIVKNVVLKNVTVASSTANHIAAVAGLVNGENARIENCKVDGSVSGIEQIGMIVGILQRGAVVGCRAAGKVAGAARLGGLVGHIADDYQKIIDSCISNVDVEGTGNNCGGIVGSIAPTDSYTADNDNTCVLVINSMYSGGSVVTSGKQVGGVAGCLQGSKYNGVKLCVVNCAVDPALLKSASFQNLGGISGYTRYGTAQNVYTTPTDGDKFLYGDTPAADKGAGGIFGGRKTSITCIDGYYAARVYCKDSDTKVKALQMTVEQMKSASCEFALPSDATVTCTSLLDALNKGVAKYNAAPLVEGYAAKEWVADAETGLPVVKLQ